VAYLSSASLLKTRREAQTRRKKTPGRPLPAFANPIYGASRTDDRTIRGLCAESYRAILGGNFAPLPETEDEARAIRDIILKAPEETLPLQRKPYCRAQVVVFGDGGIAGQHH